MNIQTLYKATSLDEAYRLLQENPKNTILGGGLWLKQTSKPIDIGIDLSLLNLNTIEEHDSYFLIGAMTPLYQLETSKNLNLWCDNLIKESSEHVMGVAFRNIATIGGSIYGRYGFSDLIGPLLTLDAEVIFYQEPPLKLDAFLKLKKAPRDVLMYIKIPKTKGKAYFKKISNTRLDFSSLNFALYKTENHLKIAIGSRPGVAMLANKTAEYVVKSGLSYDTIKEAQKILSEEIALSSNVRASESYRYQLAQVYLERALKEVF